jgi:hypothetical protein
MDLIRASEGGGWVAYRDDTVLVATADDLIDDGVDDVRAYGDDGKGEGCGVEIVGECVCGEGGGTDEEVPGSLARLHADQRSGNKGDSQQKV